MKHTVKEITLKNGAKGLFINIPDATIFNFNFNFRAGEYLVDPNKWEVPHLMEHVLLGANQKIPNAHDFHAEIEKNGAYSNASTSVYEIEYEAECADFEWQRIFDLLILSITKPLFLEEELRTEIGNVREELSSRSNNLSRKLSQMISKKVGLLVKTDQERLKLINNISLDDIKKHFIKTHQTSNLRFIIAGNITPKKEDILKTQLSKMDLARGNGRLPLPKEIPKKPDSPVIVNNRSIDNIYFYIDTFRKTQLKSSELVTLELINTYLTETLYSKILGTARERGLIYSMSSGIGINQYFTNWFLGAQCSRDNIAALFEIIVSEISKLKNGDIKDSDITATKQYLRGRFQRSAQTVSGVVSFYSPKYFFNGEIYEFKKRTQNIQLITKDEILEVVNSLINDKIWSVGFLGKTDKELYHKLYDQIAVLWV